MVNCKILKIEKSEGTIFPLNITIDYLGKERRLKLSEKAQNLILSKSDSKINVGSMVSVVRSIKPSYKNPNQMIELFFITKVVS